MKSISSFLSLYRRVKRRFWPHPILEFVRPFTMLTPERLESLLNLSTRLVKDRVSGAFVECGTCQGGSAAILAYVAKQEGWKRDLYLFDSFQGHPISTSPGAPDRDEVAKWAGKLVASEEDVKAALRSVESYVPEHVNIVPGWFQESLSKVNIPQIALLHLDADWYDSILVCLQALYDKVVPGGYLQIDDYYFYDGCRLAVDQFLSNREPPFMAQVGAALVLHKSKNKGIH
jgi:O-methyltransferase